MNAFDSAVALFVNRTAAHPALDPLMAVISELGSGEAVIVLSFLPLLLAKKGKRRTALVIWAGLTLVYIVSTVCKSAVGRPRPFAALPGIMQRADAHSYTSFPSGHAMTAFMAATVAACRFRGRAVYLALAALVAYSRVYLGVHYLTDVVAGAVLGAAIAYGVMRLDDAG